MSGYFQPRKHFVPIEVIEVLALCVKPLSLKVRFEPPYLYVTLRFFQPSVYSKGSILRFLASSDAIHWSIKLYVNL